MRLLLDSSGTELVCALADGEGVIVERRFAVGTPESRDIGSAAGQVLGELLVRELDAVVVGTGPGSFIGTRVAISYANGLAAAGYVPLYGVDSLAAIAAVHGVGRSVVLRDARRGEAYWYGPASAGARCHLVRPDDLARQLALHGINSVILEQAPPGVSAHTLPGPWLQESVSVAGVQCILCQGVPAEGLRRMQAGAQVVEYIEPVYLRGWE
jgi:tRNA threonylcarbamoyl adenosine modification protein YeaZ